MHLPYFTNERHPETRVSTVRVVHNFGRVDRVDRARLARLVSSVSRFLDPEQAVAAAAGDEVGGEVEVCDSRPLGGAWVLDRLGERLGIGAAITAVAGGRRVDAAAVERVIFALVANRAFGAVLEAGRHLVGGQAGVHRRAGRHGRRRGLPGDGLPARRTRRASTLQ